MATKRSFLSFVVVLLVLAGAAVFARATPAAATTASARTSVAVRKSNYGQILFDGRGFVLYSFTRDPRGGRSRCYGGCATGWPPYILKGKLSAGPGLQRSLLGTTKRRDGKLQVTFDGRPLYYYVGDRNAGDILCQNVNEFGGLWLIVRPGGKPVR